MADKEGKRQLKIKMGSVSRLRKEIVAYEKELEAQKAKVEKMRAEGSCGHDLRQQVAVQAETAMMIPDCRGRLETALGDLQNVVGQYFDDELIKDSEEMTLAKELIAEVEPMFE